MTMPKGRLEAFSDGVLAIILTIMVLEMKAPVHGPRFADLAGVIPVLVSYVLSFVYVGIYWNNHHHLLHATRAVSAGVMWANLHLLFWLSLIPFTTAWMGSNEFAAAPTATYGLVLLMSGAAYWVLVRLLRRANSEESAVARALRRDVKGLVSLGIYAAAIPLAFVSPMVSCGLYALVAVMWVVPDRRIERAMAEHAIESTK
jgi:uncharacterized membrane protein